MACGLWGWLHNIVHHLCWVASFSQCYKHRAFSFLWELDWNQKEATRTILILELVGKERLKQWPPSYFKLLIIFTRIHNFIMWFQSNYWEREKQRERRRERDRGKGMWPLLGKCLLRCLMVWYGRLFLTHNIHKANYLSRLCCCIISLIPPFSYCPLSTNTH